ncbi:MAG TPA: cobyrinic acid a,c-diamide synthase [Lachnospiraceae bacterium]|nr:cobyrinic acid a,c-diamide synthase [Lachnospiraceae bacterium]
MKLPRILITAAASGSGKTLCTCGLLQVLKNRGLEAVSFKCGPDYIDPMFHTKVIGTKSRNLDTFFTGRDVTRYLLQKNGAGADVAVIEGVMGYYDGLAGISAEASAWELADVTDTPAVLLVNCRGMSVSVVPMIKGFLEYKENSHIRGVILNRISPMLYPRVKAMVEEQLPVKVYGYLPELKDCLLESRHLGLVLPEEIRDLQRQLDTLASAMERSVDIDGLLELARAAEEIAGEAENPRGKVISEPIRIGVAMDEAFCFFYEDNLDYLREHGACLVPFSPIRDTGLPEGLCGLVLNGGYPELYARELSENTAMCQALREAILGGMPTTAECGGFMYLHQTMEDMDGKAWPMAGVIPGRVWKTPRLTRFGYVILQRGTAFGGEVGSLPAHEFHYFDSDACGADWKAQKPLSNRSWDCIHSTDTLFAGFPHIYYYANIKFADAFLDRCRKYTELPGR